MKSKPLPKDCRGRDQYLEFGAERACPLRLCLPSASQVFLFLVLSIQIVFGTQTLFGDQPAFSQRKAVECVPRKGLPNLNARLKSGEEVRIAYFGGSITEAAGWRVKSLEWLKRQYPEVKFSEINAAIGGTGSDLGVFRLQHDVLEFKPTLLFVEFAVNDGGADPAQIIRCFEGIVRQTWRADPQTDICFVYTTSEPVFGDLKAGKASRSASAMETVADHYGIPSIQLGMEAAQLESAGKMIFKGPKPKEPPKPEDPILFSEDGTHPLDAGHELYLQAIVRSWPTLMTDASKNPHELAAPLQEDNWQQAQLIPIDQSRLHGSWQLQDMTKDEPARHFRKRLPSLWKTSDVGATVEFQFEGRYAAFYDVLCPNGGMIEIQIDDKPPRKIARFDGYCVYSRLATLVALNEPQSAHHRIKATLLAESPDKANILFVKNRPELEKNPQKFAENAWYVGGLMIIGEMAP